MQIVCHQKKRKVKLDKVREGLWSITLRFRANARKLILVSRGTPLDHLSVKILPLLSLESWVVQTHFISLLHNTLKEKYWKMTGTGYRFERFQNGICCLRKNKNDAEVVE